MIESCFSPLTPAEVCATLRSCISAVPRAADWDISPAKPDNFFFGEVASAWFHLSPATIHEKGHPTLEIIGTVASVNQLNSTGSKLLICYRPGRFKLLMWWLLLALFLLWIGVTLLNFSEAIAVSPVVLLPLSGLLGVLAFRALYKNHVARSRRFLQTTLLLQTN